MIIGTELLWLWLLWLLLLLLSHLYARLHLNWVEFVFDKHFCRHLCILLLIRTFPCHLHLKPLREVYQKSMSFTPSRCFILSFWTKKELFPSPKINSCILVPNGLFEGSCYKWFPSLSFFVFVSKLFLFSELYRNVTLVLYKIVENILYFQWSLWKFYSISGIWSIYIKFFILNFGADSFPFAI